jgi:hypothetical protein
VPALSRQGTHQFDTGGVERVAYYLGELDLSGFDPKAPPPKTAAFYEIVDSSRAPEDAELANALDALGWPSAGRLLRWRATQAPTTSPSGCVTERTPAKFLTAWMTAAMSRSETRMPRRMGCGSSERVDK